MNWLPIFFAVLLVVVVIIAIAIKKRSDKDREKKIAEEKYERQQKAVAEAKVRKEKYEVFTEDEKNRILADGETDLNTVLLAFDKAINGDVEAMAFMGYTYKLTIKNPSKSFYWLQKASNAGYSDAKFFLGECYMNGYGVTENRVYGTSLILDAAREGNSLAIKSLLKDFGVPKEELREQGIPV